MNFLAAKNIFKTFFATSKNYSDNSVLTKVTMSSSGNRRSLSFANVFQSHGDMENPEIVPVTAGKLPHWLKGSFLFTGAGVFDFKDFTVNNLADGLAVIGKFSINQNKISFQKKILKSDAYKKAVKAGRTVLPEMTTKSANDPTKGYLARLKIGQPEVSDNANHSIFELGDEIFVSNGQTYFFSIDPKTLEIKEKYSTKNLFNLQSYGAHPFIDRDGSIYSIGVETGASIGARHVLQRISPNPKHPKELFKNHKIISKIPGSKQPLMLNICSSFGITDNFIIVMECPGFMNLSKYLSYALTGGHYCMADLMDWFPDFRNKFHIVDKHTGRVLKSNITSDSGFFYVHYINCYESDDGFIIIDLVTIPELQVALKATMENLRNDVPVSELREQGAVQRFKIPLEPVLDFHDNYSKGDVPPEIVLTPETLTERGPIGVYPNEKYYMSKYRYCYGNGSITRGPYANSMMKFDLETKNHVYFREEHCVFNEAAFVPNPEGHEEDDGILICGVCDTRKDSPHYLLFLNALDLTEITRVYFKNTIPMYTHGLYVPDPEC